MIGSSVIAGCGTATELAVGDSGPSAGDTGSVGHDTGTTITPTPDSGTMPPNDGSIVILPNDSGTITAMDAGSSMTGTDSGAAVGVMCGTAMCASTEVCCITRGAGGMMVSADCTAPTACTGASVSCDGPEDCASGEACCGSGGPGGMGTAACTPDAMCGFIRLCHVTSDCPNPGDMCCPFMGASVCSPRCF